MRKSTKFIIFSIGVICCVLQSAGAVFAETRIRTDSEVRGNYEYTYTMSVTDIDSKRYCFEGMKASSHSDAETTYILNKSLFYKWKSSQSVTDGGTADGRFAGWAQDLAVADFYVQSATAGAEYRVEADKFAGKDDTFLYGSHEIETTYRFSKNLSGTWKSGAFIMDDCTIDGRLAEWVRELELTGICYVTMYCGHCRITNTVEMRDLSGNLVSRTSTTIEYAPRTDGYLEYVKME